MRDLQDILAAMASKRGEVANSLELFLDMADRAVKTVCSEFGTKADEVALLFVTGDGKHLRFAAPRKFADLGTIPVTKRDSIAVTVFNRSRNAPGDTEYHGSWPECSGERSRMFSYTTENSRSFISQRRRNSPKPEKLECSIVTTALALRALEAGGNSA